MRRFCLLIETHQVPRALCCAFFAAVMLAMPGCGSFSRFGAAAQPVVPPPTTLVTPAPGSIPLTETGVPGSEPQAVVLGPPVPNNTILVPCQNRDFMWDQIVDVVDDYFQISQEDRVKLVGNVQTEGRVDTFPVSGATLLEPWRHDSVNYHERLESTLQSVRRIGFVRVNPQPNGYLVEVTVTKELEDVPHPIAGSAGASTFRYDTSLPRDTEFDPDPHRIPGDPARPNAPRAATGGWIPMKPDGRDHALEQQMLAQIQSRLGGIPSTVSPPPSTTVILGPQQQPAVIPPGTLVPQPTNVLPQPGPRSFYPPSGEAVPPPLELPAP
jgi:hypothetical protein